MWMSIKPSQAASHATLRLEEGAPVSFRKARGVVLECVSGRLWITITGQPGDHLLNAGERLRVESDGVGVVEGFPAGVLRVLPSGEAVAFVSAGRFGAGLRRLGWSFLPGGSPRLVTPR